MITCELEVAPANSEDFKPCHNEAVFKLKLWGLGKEIDACKSCGDMTENENIESLKILSLEDETRGE